MKFEGRAGITDDQTREAAKMADEFRGRQATLVVAGHSTGTEDCIELLAMLGLTQTPEGQLLPPYVS
ncbi:hypothetical protein [Pseudonocardia spinosispora]|uniref:hypothetical protein n=1 Tax=Pseudonocardia spinosispora TaxID=103441 RepID=UPI0004266096|nr:hypothetical protein [Pseudonocardia spinosispora]